MTHIPTPAPEAATIVCLLYPSYLGIGVGGSQGQILLGLQSKFKASLDNMPRPFLQVVLG